jgi:hypothetical protein
VALAADHGGRARWRRKRNRTPRGSTGPREGSTPHPLDIPAGLREGVTTVKVLPTSTWLVRRAACAPEGGDAPELGLPEAWPPPLDRFFAWLGSPSHAPAALGPR